ncbi:hypothetical protein BJF78_18040 [Pseudonocardia sp. CNS-139]|nr:hypothetical protein BJF78_18040 [Pseudonocardia sp. CNS-139]
MPVAEAVTGRFAVPTHRRVVAVAVSPMELLRPESDLARLAEGFPQVDLLVAADDSPVQAIDDEDEEWADAAAAEVREGIGRLGIAGLALHRLGLRQPFPVAAEDDLVAALSELVGFDPEPGVYCLAPAAAPGDPGRTVVIRAAQRIAQVYGIPLLRYRCLELSVVG